MGQECTVCTLCFRLQPLHLARLPTPPSNQPEFPLIVHPGLPDRAMVPLCVSLGFVALRGSRWASLCFPAAVWEVRRGVRPPRRRPRGSVWEGGRVCVRVCVRARARWRAAGGREERSGRQRAEREGAGGQRWGGRGAAPGFSSDTRERSHTPSSEPRESGANRAAHTPPPRAPSSPRAALQPGAGAQSGHPWSPRRLPSQLQHPPAARPPHSPCLL